MGLKAAQKRSVLMRGYLPPSGMAMRVGAIWAAHNSSHLNVHARYQLLKYTITLVHILLALASHRQSFVGSICVLSLVSQLPSGHPFLSVSTPSSVSIVA
jgi:hypothetical protein